MGGHRRSALTLCASLIAANAFAQSGLGSISGTVVDQTGARLSGALVRLVEGSTGAARTATSNEAGLFTLAAVPPGTYTIVISRNDFKPKRFADITVNSFQQVALGEVPLEIAVAASDSVVVTATSPILDLNSGVRANTIQAEQVQNIPLQGRNGTTLLKIIPGANPTNRDAISGREYASNGYADFRINGKNPQQTQVNLDGGSSSITAATRRRRRRRVSNRSAKYPFSRTTFRPSTGRAEGPSSTSSPSRGRIRFAAPCSTTCAMRR